MNKYVEAVVIDVMEEYYTALDAFEGDLKAKDEIMHGGELLFGVYWRVANTVDCMPVFRQEPARQYKNDKELFLWSE